MEDESHIRRTVVSPDISAQMPAEEVTFIEEEQCAYSVLWVLLEELGLDALPGLREKYMQHLQQKHQGA